MKNKEFGNRLKYLREQKGLIQAQAAHLVGMSYSALQGHDRGNLPNRNNLKKYSDFYGCDEVWLLTGVGEPFPGKSDEDIFVKEPGAPYNEREREGEKWGMETLGPDPVNGSIHEQFKLSKALTAAARVLESKTSYAVALYVNIQHFDRAIRAETRITQLEQNNKSLEKRIFNLEKKLLTPKGAANESGERKAA